MQMARKRRDRSGKKKKAMKKPENKRHIMKRRKRSVKEVRTPKQTKSRIIHQEEYHGPEYSAWDFLKKSQIREFESFSQDYFNSLSNRTVTQRTKFIIDSLENNGFKPIKQLTGGRSLAEIAGGDFDLSGKFGAGSKFYDIFQEDLIIAGQLGRKLMQKGIHLAFAHTDSPCLAGIGSFKQDYGIAYTLAEPVGDFNPDNWFNVPLTLHFEGFRKNKGTRRLEQIDFTVGDQDGDPCFAISNESSHLGDGEPTSRNQLKVILSNKPCFKRADPKTRVLSNILDLFYKEFGVTREDFKNAKITFVPSVKQKWIGADYSLISGFGQDAWGCGVPLLWGFTNTKNPEYTAVLHFHPGEETGDETRASVATNYASDVFLPAIAELRGEDLGKHYKGLIGNGISVWADTMEAIHGSRPDLHEPHDSAYVGAGVVFERQSGDEDRWDGYVSSPAVLAGFGELFKEKNIPYQIATCGHAEERIPGCTKIHHPLFTEGINWALPLLGSHKGAGEISSPIDLWTLACAAKAFYSMKNHDDYFPKTKKFEEPERLKTLK